jgi:hypothetical protein
MAASIIDNHFRLGGNLHRPSRSHWSAVRERCHWAMCYNSLAYPHHIHCSKHPSAWSLRNSMRAVLPGQEELEEDTKTRRLRHLLYLGICLPTHVPRAAPNTSPAKMRLCLSKSPEEALGWRKRFRKSSTPILTAFSSNATARLDRSDPS